MPKTGADQTLPTAPLVLQHRGVQPNLRLPPGHPGVALIQWFWPEVTKGKGLKKKKESTGAASGTEARAGTDPRLGFRSRWPKAELMDVFWDG